MPSQSIAVQGTSIEISTTPQTELHPSTPAAFSALDCTAREMNWQGGQRTSNDATTICSTAKEKRAGLRDPGTMSVAGFWKIGAPGHEALKTAYDDDTNGYYIIRITFVDGSVWMSLGQVTQRGFAMTVDGLVNASYSLELSGEVEETAGP